MNKSIEKIKSTAKRTLKIISHIEEGLSANEIVQKIGANRQLVDYYIKVSKRT